MSRIWIISDDSHRTRFSQEIVKRLGSAELTISVNHHMELKGFPDLAIGAGERTSDMLLKIKSESLNKTNIISILDPRKEHHAFDLIVVPDHEPIPPGNVLTTLGYINYINRELLCAAKNIFIHLKPPIYAVLLGGRYVGGNIEVEDAKNLATLLNQLGGSLAITTSARTEKTTSDALRESIKVPYFFYDYKNDRHMPNPYISMLAHAHGIIVTGDSARMCSEACSSGKPVSIFLPKDGAKQYQHLHKSLIDQNYANIFTGNLPPPTLKPLDEAGRIADFIALKYFKV